MKEDEVKECGKGKRAHYKVKRCVRCRDDYRMTVAGKVQKYKMREISAKELKLKEQATA